MNYLKLFSVLNSYRKVLLTYCILAFFYQKVYLFLC